MNEQINRAKNSFELFDNEKDYPEQLILSGKRLKEETKKIELPKDNRKNRKASQDDIAQFLHTNRNRISSAMCGKRLLDLTEYIKLSKYFNVRLEYLLGLDDYESKEDYLTFTLRTLAEKKIDNINNAIKLLRGMGMTVSESEFCSTTKYTAFDITTESSDTLYQIEYGTKPFFVKSSDILVFQKLVQNLFATYFATREFYVTDSED